MRREHAQELTRSAQECAKAMTERDIYNAETFEVEHIKPLSEDTACVIYLKSSGKRALAFFYYMNSSNARWMHFFPTDSHLLGMSQVAAAKQLVEEQNFPINGD